MSLTLCCLSSLQVSVKFIYGWWLNCCQGGWNSWNIFTCNQVSDVFIFLHAGGDRYKFWGLQRHWRPHTQFSHNHVGAFNASERWMEGWLQSVFFGSYVLFILWTTASLDPWTKVINIFIAYTIYS